MRGAFVQSLATVANCGHLRFIDPPKVETADRYGSGVESGERFRKQRHGPYAALSKRGYLESRRMEIWCASFGLACSDGYVIMKSCGRRLAVRVREDMLRVSRVR